MVASLDCSRLDISIRQEMASNSHSTLQAANKQVVEKMIEYAERKRSEPGLGQAMSWIIEILRNSGPTNNFYQHVNGASNQVVEVENIFEGQTGNGETWKMRFIINADLPNEVRNQEAHFGGEVHWNKERMGSIHAWLPGGVLTVGRPTSPSVMLEEFQTGTSEKKFDPARHICWKSISKNTLADFRDSFHTIFHMRTTIRNKKILRGQNMAYEVPDHCFMRRLYCYNSQKSMHEKSDTRPIIFEAEF